jgi:hypothetical protein
MCDLLARNSKKLEEISHKVLNLENLIVIQVRGSTLENSSPVPQVQW